MNRRRAIRSLCCAALAVTAVSLSSTLLAAEEVKIGFLVKQAEEPWFQTEWAFAEKAGKEKGFTLIKIAVPDGEKTLSAIDSLAANGAKGFDLPARCVPGPGDHGQGQAQRVESDRRG